MCDNVIIGVEKAAEEAYNEGLQYPTPCKDGRLNTMNNMGAMFPVISSLALQFEKIACQPGTKVLEIGPAYGYVCLHALKSGASDYTVVELDARHLKILAQKVVDEVPEKSTALTLVRGNFLSSKVFKELAENQYDAILAEKVLHFFSRPQFEQALHHVYRLLKPGGRLLINGGTPYCNLLTGDFRIKFELQLEIFLQKLQNGVPLREDEPLPGFISQAWNGLDFQKIHKYGMKVEDLAMPQRPTFAFHPETLTYLLQKADLSIENMEFSPLPGVWYLDGRELLNAVAYKPSF